MHEEDSIKRFIVNNLNFRGTADQLTSDYPLMEREAIDSMGIFQLVGFIEDEYGIEIVDEDLTPENFASIEAIASLVQRKRDVSPS